MEQEKQEGKMYEPVRKHLEEQGYLVFVAREKKYAASLKKSKPQDNQRALIPFALDFGLQSQSGSGRDGQRGKKCIPDVVAFRWKSSHRNETEIETIAVECKTGSITEGIRQAIDYLPFFHKVYICTPNDMDKFSKKFLKALCCGYKALVENKVKPSAEANTNTFFDSNKHNEQIKQRFIMFLTFEEVFSKKNSRSRWS